MNYLGIINKSKIDKIRQNIAKSALGNNNEKRIEVTQTVNNNNLAPNYALNLPKTEGKSDILYINLEKGNLKISLKPDHKNEIVR